MQLNLHRGSRSYILAVTTLGIMAVFVVRLFYLQIIDHNRYVTLANQEQLKRLVIPAKRGEIYAMDGSTPVKIVLNEAVYTVFVDPTLVDQPDKVVALIRKVAGGNAQPDLETLVAKKDTRYQIVAKRVSRTQAELMKKEDLRGVGFQETTQRVYPEGELAAQTLGFVSNDGVGQYGIEGQLNDRLKGKDGVLQSVTDVRNVPLTIGNNNINIPAKDGDNIALTIDRNVQSYAEKALADGMKKSGASSGSAIVMDPQTGKVLAMANLPTYNPADFGHVMDAQAFNNVIITSPYEPGSVMKTFTAATAIDKGVMKPTSTYNNTDHLSIDGWGISNATLGQTGTITIQHALNYSLNTGFVTVAEWLGDGSTITLDARNTMYSYLHDKFHLGQLAGIQLAGEQPGVIIPPTNPEGNAIRYANMSFGQGMNLTMLQVASGFSAIVNGGIYHKPTVIAGDINNDGVLSQSQPTTGQQIIAPSTSETTKTMIHDARAAFYSASDKPGYDIGGKTGTSQTLVNNSYDNNQTVGSYLGYGGDTKARYVIMVQVSSPGKTFEGNRDAMPVFTDISNWLLDYMKIAPKG
ncbi:MAG: penicillin-binding protein 2 [Candidatus Saccharibacteria bacterium]